MTQTDTDFAARFPDMTVATFLGNNTNLAQYVPTQNPFNNGMWSDVGRAIIYSNDIFKNNFYSRFLRAPLQRGTSIMKAFFNEGTSSAYNPLAPDTALFNQRRAEMKNNIFTKNYSRQIGLEVNDRLIKQYVQTPEMIGEAQAAIMSSIASTAADDLWVASKTFFSGSTRGMRADQMYTMTNGITDAGGGAELIEAIWKMAVNRFRFKSSRWNSASHPTYSTNVHVAIKKDWEWPSFKKLLSETFNEQFIDPTKFGLTIDFVDDFATTGGKPTGSGDLCAMITDDRVFDIVPMPDGYVMETFRNPSRHSTVFFQTTECAFGHFTGYNQAMIFEKGA